MHFTNGVALLFVGMMAGQVTPASAQRMEPPSKSDARTATERAAYDKAMCVYRGLTEAGKVFTPATGATKATPETQARAKVELDQWGEKSKSAVRACLSEADVTNLGRFSFMEDFAFSVGSPCRVAKAPAAKFERTPNNNDGDIVNAATKWLEIPDKGPLEAHPFFKAQADARAEFRDRRDRIVLCRAILDEFGPNGTKMPGMVRSR